MNDKALRKAIETAEKLITDAEGRKAQAIRLENWRRAAELDALIEGQRQILELFKLAAE